MQIQNITFEKIELPFSPEPNTASPTVEIINGKNILLSFMIEGGNDSFGKILFKDCVMYRVGDPNDEGFYSFETNPRIRNNSIYSKKNFPDLKFDCFYEVIGYQISENLLGEKTIILDQDYKEKMGTHYIFFMKDGSFECIASDFEIQKIK